MKYDQHMKIHPIGLLTTEQKMQTNITYVQKTSFKLFMNLEQLVNSRNTKQEQKKFLGKLYACKFGKILQF